MALHAGHAGNLPRLRQSPVRTISIQSPSKGQPRGISLSNAIPMEQLNRATSDTSTRLHATTGFIVGLSTIAAAIALL